MVHSFEDIVIKVGSQADEIYCSSADMNVDSALKPVYSTKSKYAFTYAPEQGSRGNLSFSYYMTGVDPLYNHVINEAQPISVNFAGMTINSGYLKSYEFSVDDTSAISVDASLVFFEKVRGTFVTGSSTLPDTEFLNSVNVSLSNGDYISHDDLASLDYSYNTDFTPNYVCGFITGGGVEENSSHEEIAATSVVPSEKDVSLSFKAYKYDLDLPTTGKMESVRIDLEDRGGSIVNSFYANGVISSKDISIGAGSKIAHTYDLTQANLGGVAPYVSSLSDTYVDVGDTLNIYGTNLSDVESVIYLGNPCEVISNTSVQVSIKVPSESYLSGIGPVILTTKAGEVSSLSSMMVTGDLTLGVRAPELF